LFDEHASRAAQCEIGEEANPKIISEALKRGLVDLGHQEKGTRPIPQQETRIISWIEEESARNKHASWKDTLHYVRDKYRLALTKGWVNYFFLRHQDPVSQSTSRSQELPRLQVPRIFLERTIKQFQKVLVDCGMMMIAYSRHITVVCQVPDLSLFGMGGNERHHAPCHSRDLSIQFRFT
jgi:hypothetical protein